MGRKKKTKKIKSRCHNCGERNKFAPEHWYGRSKTKCKNCGEFLNKVNPLGDNNHSLCKEVKQETMENQNNNLQYSMIRPVRTKQTANKKRWYKRWWVMGLIILTICCGAVTVYNVDSLPINAPPMYSFDQENIPQDISLNPPWSEGDLCLQIEAVPAWAKDGKVKKRGYAPLRQNVDYLIKENITFLYSSNCGYCRNEIEKFGEDWQRYVDSGLTKECW